MSLDDKHFSGIEAWFQHYRLVILAMVGSFVFHGALLLAGTYRNTYDAYVHIFFADHYARTWWDLWEPRWYTGFTMVSYPPLTHHLTALLSYPFSLTSGFIIVMVTSSVLTTLGVYRFSLLWVDHRPACYAALLVVFSSSIAETIHLFGQLPTMFVMGVMLNALPFVAAWIERGNPLDFIKGLALLMVAAAGHHVTTLFGMVFFSGPIFATLLLDKFRTPRADEPDYSQQRFTLGILRKRIIIRIKRVFPTLIRCAMIGVALIFIIVFTVLPYWLWSSSDPITQISIPHGSRENFIQNQSIGFMFFVVPWGLMILILPYALYKGFSSRNWIVACSLALMTLLGTGGTTPIPAFLLRAAFYILTLDRFTFWSTIIILPFAGQFVESLVHGRLGLWLSGHFGNLVRWLIAASFGGALIGVALFVANLAQFRRFQPAPLDMGPIVEFLHKDNHDRWRYLTLGFGDQMAWLSAQTTAASAEGNYHSARRLPEMTSTPIERLDGAKFTSIPGLGSLDEFVTYPQRYNLKYIFLNDAFYKPLLYFNGWHFLGVLDNDVEVWERADVPPIPTDVIHPEYPIWQRLMWGILPVGSLGVTAIAFLVIPVLAHWMPPLPLSRRIRKWRLVSGWLMDAGTHPDKPSDDWQVWRILVRRFVPPLNLNPLVRRSIYGTVILLMGLAILGAGFRQWRQKQVSPEQTVLAYYDALDFKRFAESYTYLQTDLTQEEYLRWLSLQGGLVRSFGKLNNLYIDLEPRADDSYQADIIAEWLTALGTYPQHDTYHLIKTDAGWKLMLDVVPPPLPSATLITTQSNAYFINTPLASLDETDLQRGVLDRTLLMVGSVTVLYAPDVPIGFEPTEPPDVGREGRYHGLISVVGVVANVDSLPAQVTITAALRDADGNRLADTNAGDVMLHQLLPGESTPFRVDFSGARAVQILELDTIASVDISIRGIPTQYNLARPLILTSNGQLYNASSQMVDVPRVLYTTVDDYGLSWPDRYYLPEAVAPDESITFTLPDTTPVLLPFDIDIAINGPRLLHDPTLPMPALIVDGFSQ
ncbi:MAG: hypothetical protein H6673_05995 [Anaerolineales bacterium]|nr:hypothetical protein [Anaerolineales bacterium]